MSDQANQTPVVDPKPVITPEPGNVAKVDPAKAPVAVIEPAKAG